MQNKAARLNELFYGCVMLSKLIGVDQGVTSRWPSDGPRGGHGRVPQHYNDRIMAAARRARIDLDAVAACLEPNVCPCCKQYVPDGARLERMVPLSALPNKVRKRMGGK